MISPLHPRCGYAKAVVASIALTGLVVFATVSQADTAVPASGDVTPGHSAADTEISFWVDAAPLELVIRQLAFQSNRIVELEEPEKTEQVAEAEEVTESPGFDEALVSGRFSGTLGSTLERLSMDYPVTFDLDGETLRVMKGAARSNVSIAMLSTTFDEAFRNELLESSGAGNSVEFRDDAVRVSGHPAFVKRQSGYITKALSSAEARLNAESETTTTAAADATSVADSGSAQVLADIQDEGKPPAEQANLSRPIRWVTDIPGYNTF